MPPKAFKRGFGVGPARPALKRPAPKPGVVRPFNPMLPPAGTYDPAFGAQIRASQRGLGDKLLDTRAEQHFAKRDLAQSLRDIRTKVSRNQGGINRDFTRASRDFDNKEADLQQKATRAREDFSTQLANIGRQFQQLGQRQREGANAAGVLGGGTEAAASVARQQNQTLAEAPVHTAQARMEEDLAQALRRLGEGRAELGEDRGRSLRHLLTDRDRSRMLERRRTGRAMFGLGHTRQRAIREQAIVAQDLADQARFDARQRHPAALKRWRNLSGRITNSYNLKRPQNRRKR